MRESFLNNLVITVTFESIQPRGASGGICPGKVGLDQIVDGNDGRDWRENGRIKVESVEQIGVDCFEQARELQLLSKGVMRDLRVDFDDIFTRGEVVELGIT